jgi:RNA polymerase sigma-70 factor (ECF subfamily)
LFEKKNISKLSDEELLALYNSSGETAYFGELYNRYIPLLYGVCLKYLHDAGKAQDAVMQLFENLLPKISHYEITVFRTWIYSVSKNHCLQILRKENKEIPVDLGAKCMESCEVLHLLSEDEEDGERMEALKNCMEKLPERQRISITHFFMDEMSYVDIAESTGYTLSHVKSYIQNGKRNLKICIEKHTG